MATFPGFTLLLLGVLSQIAITFYIFYKYWAIFVNGQEPLVQQIVLAQSLIVLLLGLTKLLFNWKAFSALLQALAAINYFLFFIQIAASFYAYTQNGVWANIEGTLFTIAVTLTCAGYQILLKEEG